MYIKKILLATVLVGLVLLGIFSYHIYNVILAPNTSFSSQTETVYIPTGATYAVARDSLGKVLDNMENFDVVAQKKGYIGHVRAGRFILKKNMNNNQIIDVLRSRNSPVSVIYNNQERLRDLAGRVATQIEADSISLLKAMQDTSFLAANGFTSENALAMYIPNKYEFFWNTSAEDFRERMLKEYNRFWTPEKLAKAKDIGLTPQQVAVLASIVQKETSKTEERPKVAGVYMNRFHKGWKLEADPTVIYAIKRQNNDFDTIIKRVLYKDLQLDSPYNTYKYASLPPGPITMPDISSLNAVLNYTKHDYYYFVADVENFGYHKFSKTLSEHNRNKRAYVNWINKQGINR
ncbi:MAG: endolytic transglycosylase MltG [Gillisia sp.]